MQLPRTKFEFEPKLSEPKLRRISHVFKGRNENDEIRVCVSFRMRSQGLHEKRSIPWMCAYAFRTCFKGRNENAEIRGVTFRTRF